MSKPLPLAVYLYSQLDEGRLALPDHGVEVIRSEVNHIGRAGAAHKGHDGRKNGEGELHGKGKGRRGGSLSHRRVSQIQQSRVPTAVSTLRLSHSIAKYESACEGMVVHLVLLNKLSILFTSVVANRRGFTR